MATEVNPQITSTTPTINATSSEQALRTQAQYESAKMRQQQKAEWMRDAKGLEKVKAFGKIAGTEMVESLAKLRRADKLVKARKKNGGSAAELALAGLAKQEGKSAKDAKHGERIVEKIVAQSTIHEALGKRLFSPKNDRLIQKLRDGSITSGQQRRLEKRVLNELNEVAKELPKDPTVQEFFGKNATQEERLATAKGLIELARQLQPQDAQEIADAFKEQEFILEKAHKGSGYLEEQYKLSTALAEFTLRNVRTAAVIGAAAGVMSNPFTLVPAIGVAASGVITYFSQRHRLNYDRAIALIDQTRGQERPKAEVNGARQLLQKIWGDVDLTADDDVFKRQRRLVAAQRAGVVSIASFAFGALAHGGVEHMFNVHDSAHAGLQSIANAKSADVNAATTQSDMPTIPGASSHDALRALATQTDTHNCFVAGTLILMADGTQKVIEQVAVGEKVYSYDEESKEIVIQTVEEIVTPIHEDMVVITFANGTKNTNTYDHPYFIKGKGWASHQPNLTLKNYGLKVESLSVGDKAHAYGDKKLEEVEITSIHVISETTQTYNLSKIAQTHTYFANGILVHNKFAGVNIVQQGSQGNPPWLPEQGPGAGSQWSLFNDAIDNKTPVVGAVGDALKGFGTFIHDKTGWGFENTGGGTPPTHEQLLQLKQEMTAKYGLPPQDVKFSPDGKTLQIDLPGHPPYDIAGPPTVQNGELVIPLTNNQVLEVPHFTETQVSAHDFFGNHTGIPEHHSDAGDMNGYDHYQLPNGITEHAGDANDKILGTWQGAHTAYDPNGKYVEFYGTYPGAKEFIQIDGHYYIFDPQKMTLGDTHSVTLTPLDGGHSVQMSQDSFLKMVGYGHTNNIEAGNIVNQTYQQWSDKYHITGTANASDRLAQVQDPAWLAKHPGFKQMLQTNLSAKGLSTSDIHYTALRMGEAQVDLNNHHITILAQNQYFSCVNSDQIHSTITISGGGKGGWDWGDAQRVTEGRYGEYSPHSRLGQLFGEGAARFGDFVSDHPGQIVVAVGGFLVGRSHNSTSRIPFIARGPHERLSDAVGMGFPLAMGVAATVGAINPGVAVGFIVAEAGGWMLGRFLTRGGGGGATATASASALANTPGGPGPFARLRNRITGRGTPTTSATQNNANQPPASGQPPVPPPSATPVAQPSVNAINSTIAAPTPRNRQGASNLYTNTAQTINTNRPTADSGKMDASHVQGLDEIAKAGGVQRGTDDTNYQHAQRINRVIQSNKRARNLDLTSHTNAETAARFAGVGEDDVQDVARHLQRNAIAQKHGRGNLADARQEMMQKVDGNATTPEIARDQVLAMAPVLQTTEVNKARAAIHRAFSNETDPSVRAVVGTLAENNSDAAKRVEAGLRFAGLTPKEERYGPLRKRRTVLPGTQAVVEAVNAIRQTKAINESGWAMQKLSDSAADQAIVAGVRAVYPNNPEYVRTVEAALAVPPPPNQPQRQELQLNLEQLTPGPEVPRAPDLTQDFKDKVPPQADMSTYSLKPEVRNELDAFMPTIRLENKVKNFITVTDNVAGEVDLDEPFMATEGNRIYPNPVIVGPMYYFVDATKSGPDRDQNKTFNESEKIAGGQNFFTGISGIMGGEIELGQAKSDLRAETQASAVLALGDAILQVYDKLGAEKLERHLQTQVGDPTSQTSLMYVAHDYVRQNPSVPKDADANSVISHFIQKIQGSQGQIKVGDTLSPETGVNPDSTLFVLKVSQETVGGNQVILPSVDLPATLAKIQALLPSIKTRLHNGELTNYDAMLLEFLGNGLDVTRLAQYIAAQNKGNGGQQNPQPPAGPGNPPPPDPNQPPGSGSAADALHSNVPDPNQPGGPNSPDNLGGPGDPNRDTSQRPVLPANFENELIASASSKRRDKYSRVAEAINRGREQKIKPGQINELIRLGKQDQLQASLKDTTDFGRARVLEAAITGDTKYPLDLQDATNAAVVVRLVGNITDAAELGRVARNIQRIAVARKMPHRTSEDFVAIRNQLNTLFDTGQPTYQVVIEQARAMLVVDATRDSLKNAFATESTDTRVSLGFALTVSKDDGVKVSHAMEFADLTDGHGKMPQEIQPSLSREEGAQKVAKALDALRSMYFAREPDKGNSIIAEAVSQAYTDRQFVKRVGELLQVTIPTPTASQQPPNFSPGGQDTSVPSGQPASNSGSYTPRPAVGFSTKLPVTAAEGDPASSQDNLPDLDRDRIDGQVIAAQDVLWKFLTDKIAEKRLWEDEVTIDLSEKNLTALLQAGQDTQFDSWDTKNYVVKSYTEKGALRLEANNAGNDDELQQCAFIVVSGDQQYLRGRRGSFSGTPKDQTMTDEAAESVAKMLQRRILSAVPRGWDFVGFELPLGVGGALKIKLEQHDSSASSSPDNQGNGGGTVLTEEQVHMAGQDTKSNEAVHPEQPTGGDYQSELTAITQGIQTGHPTVTADAVATVASFMNNHVDRVKELNSERGGRQTLLNEVREEAQKQHNIALERIEDLALDSVLSTLGRGFRPPSPDDVPEYQQEIENMKNFLNLQKVEDARKAAEIEQERSKRVSDIRSAAISWGEKRGTPEADAALEKLVAMYKGFDDDIRPVFEQQSDNEGNIVKILSEYNVPMGRSPLLHLAEAPTYYAKSVAVYIGISGGKLSLEDSNAIVEELRAKIEERYFPDDEFADEAQGNSSDQPTAILDAVTAGETAHAKAETQLELEADRQKRKDHITKLARLLGDSDQGAMAEQALLDLYPDFRQDFKEVANTTEETGYNELLNAYGMKYISHETFISLRDSGQLKPEDFFLTFIKTARKDAPAANEAELMTTLQQKLQEVEQSLAGDEPSIADQVTDEHPTTILPPAGGIPASAVTLASTMGNTVGDIAERQTVPSMPTSYRDRADTSQGGADGDIAAMPTQISQAIPESQTSGAMEFSIDGDPTAIHHTVTPSRIESAVAPTPTERNEILADIGVHPEAVKDLLAKQYRNFTFSSQNELGRFIKKYIMGETLADVKRFFGENPGKVEEQVEVLGNLINYRLSEISPFAAETLQHDGVSISEAVNLQETGLLNDYTAGVVLHPYLEDAASRPMHMADIFAPMLVEHVASNTAMSSSQEALTREVNSFWEGVNQYLPEGVLTVEHERAYKMLQWILPDGVFHRAFVLRAQKLIRHTYDYAFADNQHAKKVLIDEATQQAKASELTWAERLMGGNKKKKLPDSGEVKDEGYPERVAVYDEMMKFVPMQILAPSPELFRSYIEEYYEVALDARSDAEIERARKDILDAERKGEQPKIYDVERYLDKIAHELHEQKFRTPPVQPALPIDPLGPVQTA